MNYDILCDLVKDFTGRLSLRQYKDPKPAQAALRSRFLWGVGPKAPDCGCGISPQKTSQTPFVSKPPDFFGLSTAA